MTILITESQKNFIWLLRRLYETDMVDHMSDIVYEGTWHISGCDYESFDEYQDDVIRGSVETFINSYEDTFESKEGLDDLVKYLYNLMKKKYRKYLLDKFTDEREEC